MKITRTNSQNSDFIDLVKLLDIEMAILDGEEHAFYSQFNKIDHLKFVLVAYENDLAVGCGAIKNYETNAMEVKRMYVLPEYRGKGIATKILVELEKWALELDMNKCVLETGKRQPDAIALYKKNGYNEMPNYGQYTNIENSVCFEKYLNKKNDII